MFSKVTLALIFAGAVLVSANVEQQDASSVKGNHDTTGFEIQKGYSMDGNVDWKGRPSGKAQAYISLKAGPGPQVDQQYYTTAESSAVQPQTQYYIQQAAGSSLWSGQFGNFFSAAAYFAAGVAAAASVWYSTAVFCGGPSSKKSIDDLEDDSKTEKEEKPAKTRRRRSATADEELTRLASMVLAAIESGECMQKSICLMGSQVGTGKGRLAATVLDKLIPLSVQGSPYFVTFRNALRGEAYCNKIRCKY